MSPDIVKRRLKLGAVSPKLMDIYRQDGLIRDLTAHRTLGLRLAADARTGMALVALTHAMVAQLFYRNHDSFCVEISAKSADLRNDADGIAMTEAGEALTERHDHWAERLPADVFDLWAFVAALDTDSLLDLLTHCTAQTVNAVKLPWERKTRQLAAAETLAQAVDLDMTAHWTPTARTYFGRVTKAQIGMAVREAVSPEAAERIAPMKKADMADSAEQLVSGTGWLPIILRTVPPVEDVDAASAETIESGAAATDVVAAETNDEAADAITSDEPDEVEAPHTEAEDGDAHFAVAAE